MSYKSNVYIIKEDNWYVANSIETGVASQGKSIEEAISNLKEALSLYYEDNIIDVSDYRPSFVTSIEVDI